MPVCPVCGTTLETVPQRNGVFYRCETCGGRALTIPQVRRVAGDHFAVKLLRLLRLNRNPADGSCPFCNQRLASVKVQEPPLELQACGPCAVVWFSAENYAHVPEWTVSGNTGVSMQDIEAEALRRLREEKEKEKAEAEEAKNRRTIRKSLRTLWKQGERDDA